MFRNSAVVRLLREAPMRDTLALVFLMIFTRLTEGVGILMLIPIIDSLLAGDASTVFSAWIGSVLKRTGLEGSIGVLLTLFAALVILRSLLNFAQQILSLRYQHELIDNMGKRCYGQLLAAEWRWISQARSSDHANVLITGIARLKSGVNHLLNLATSVATLLVYSAVALILSWKVTLFAAMCGGITHLLLFQHRKRALMLGNGLSSANRAIFASIQEGLAGIRMTKILHNERRSLASFSKFIRQARAQELNFAVNTSVTQLLVQGGSALLLAGLLYVGISWWALHLSVLVTIVLVFGRLIPIFSAIQKTWHQWLHSVPALDELQALIEASSKSAEPANELQVIPLTMHESIELDSVSVAYGDRSRLALDDISIRIPARTTTALIGASGAGKSTLADVLMALIEPDKGSMKVDGLKVTGDIRHRWRGSVSYVQQNPFLFNGTVRANLLWSHPDASNAEIEAALSAAAADFVSDLPDGIDTNIGDGGVRLSGGERQRIALARALFGKPTLLILDEATSALDPENEALVRRAISELHGELTLVIIGHRLSDLDDVDQILRIEGGRITADVMA